MIKAGVRTAMITTRAVPVPLPRPRVAAAQRLLTATLPTPWERTVDNRDAKKDYRAAAVREAVIANRDTINATLRAGGGRMWCCLAALAMYPAPCPFGHLPGRRRT